MQIVPKMAKKQKKAEFPKPVVKLTREAKAIRGRVLKEWILTDASIILLDKALNFLDLGEKYQATLDREGLSLTNPVTGATRPHPALAALKLARTNFLSAWRMLGLKDPQTQNPPGRPVANYPTPEE